MAINTRNECSRHCIFLKSYILLPSQWYAHSMSLNESSVQGKYLQISRLGTVDHTDLGTMSWLWSLQIQALYAYAAVMTSDCMSQHVLRPSSSSSESQHNAPLGQKSVLLQRSPFPCAHKPVAKSAKWRVQMGERKAKPHSAGAPTQTSNAARGMVRRQVLAFIAHPYQDTGV